MRLWFSILINRAWMQFLLGTGTFIITTIQSQANVVVNTLIPVNRVISASL